jgi:hypothetical protein
MVKRKHNQKVEVNTVANGAIIYQGPSPVDGREVVFIATGLSIKSENPKTGVMIQTFILDVEVAPHIAQKLGLDESTCGNCNLRPSLVSDGEDKCYVLTFQSPNSVWKAFKRGSYPVMTASQVGKLAKKRKRPIRLGAFGDPAMIPFEIVAELLDSAQTGHTGYTHQWREGWFDSRFLSITMASVDNDDQLAQLPTGARYFRVSTKPEPGTGEIICPATQKDKDGNRRSTCDKCLLCAGTNKSAKNIVTEYQ